MKRSHRIRRIFKWAGVGVCGLIVAAWSLSLRTSIMYFDQLYPSSVTPSPTTPGGVLIRGNCRLSMLGGGVLMINGWGGLPPGAKSGWRVFSGFGFGQFGYGFVWPQVSATGTQVIPLWLPLVLIAAPTALLIVGDIRRSRENRRVRGWRLLDLSDGLPTFAVEEAGAADIQTMAYARVRPSMRWKARLERLSDVPSFAIAAVAAVFLFVAGTAVLDVIARAALGDNCVSDAGISETANTVILLAVAMFAAYLGARTLYFLLRFRTIRSGTPICPRCAYDVRGNQSGVCPECGAALPSLKPQGSAGAPPMARKVDAPELVRREKNAEQAGQERDDRRRQARESYLALKRSLRDGEGQRGSSPPR